MSQPLPPTNGLANGQKPEDLIQVLDEHGNPLLIPRAEFQQAVRGMVQQAGNDPQTLRQLAEGLLRDGFPAEARMAAERLRTLGGPPADGIESILAGCFVQMGQLPQAEQVLRSAIKRNPGDLALEMNLAQVRGMQGDHQAVAAAARKVLALDPNESGALTLLYQAAQNEGRLPDALAEMEAMAEANPLAWRPLVMLGMLHAQVPELADVDRAIDFFQRAAERQPDEPEVLINWSGELGRANRLDEMVELLEPLKKDRTADPRLLHNLARGYMGLGKPSDAMLVAQMARQGAAEPFHAMLDQLISEIYAAVEAGQKTIPLNPPPAAEPAQPDDDEADTPTDTDASGAAPTDSSAAQPKKKKRFGLF